MSKQLNEPLLLEHEQIGSVPDLKSDRTQEPNREKRADSPVFHPVSIHDPAIVKDGDMFYIFGTHIAAAKSADLIHWQSFANGYATPDNKLYGDLSGNLCETFKWAGENDADCKGGFGVWAPDVFYNKMFVNKDGSKGAYMIYYSASSTYIRSAIGFAVSQTIEGPYEYIDTVVYSGFTKNDMKDENSDINKKWTGTNIPSLIEKGLLQGPRDDWFNPDGSYNNYEFPNAIDAAMFHDKDGKLWMAYGSWSGGIYILEMDEETGKAIYPGEDGETTDGRLVDRYFGTKIAGGYFKSGEGPYITYDNTNGYYYLYVTYGWLGADGGYNMRQFRSAHPDGPYVDAAGLNAVLQGDIENTPFGNKIMGNFQFDRKNGEEGSGLGVGYLSPGHNSVYLDEKTGQQFLIFHTRFPEKGEYFEARVHQMFINKDGWSIVAPYPYNGESLVKVAREDLAGDYQFINHGKEYSANINLSVRIRLEEDGSISGNVTGSWLISGDFEAELVIDGHLYNGVFLRQWDPASNRKVIAFTALSAEGISIWGSRGI